MDDINLLKDKESLETESKKKTGGFGVELTRPKKEKDATAKQLKKGGITEFFKNIFKREKKERILSQKVVKTEENVGKINHGRKKAPKIKKVEENVQVENEDKPNISKKTLKQEPIVEKIKEQQDPVIINDDQNIKQPEIEILKKDKKKKNKKKFFTWTTPKDEAKQKESATKLKKEESSDPVKEEKKKVVLQENNVKNPVKGPGISKLTSSEPLEERIQSLDVNLIPDDILVKLEPKSKLIQTSLFLGIVVVLIGIVYGYMMYLESKIEGDIDEVVIEIADIDYKLDELSGINSEAQALKSQIDYVSRVMDSHIYWSQFLESIEKYTLENVYYKSLSATKSGVVHLTATAIDLATLADQYTIFQNASDFVESVTIESAVSASQEEDETNTPNAVDFNIELEVNPDIFSLKEDITL